MLKSSQLSLGSGVSCRVAALNVSPLDTYIYPPEVKWKIDQNNEEEYLALAEDCNRDPNITGIFVQHEYGIYGGSDGEKILAFIENCIKPLIITLHTVLPNPTVHMKQLTEQIIKHAQTIVVLTHSSKKIIGNLYPHFIDKVKVIPHGIHFTPFTTTAKPKQKLHLQNKVVISTFGLLSRGKGIEYVLEALPEIVKEHPSLVYLILGKTHPVVRRQEGENYRKELADLVIKLHLEKNVTFFDQYLSVNKLLEFLKATDIYISTSINPNQAVSGTLSYALGTGRAVISTEFTQAKEIITNEIGRLVPIKNSSAFRTALADLLSDPDQLQNMHTNAYKITRTMVWSNVAKDYNSLLNQNTIPIFKIDHLLMMTDSVGLFQFATFTMPNKDFGYTLDDNARALVLCSRLITKNYTKKVADLLHIYLNFIKKCLQPNGAFVNYLNYTTTNQTPQNQQEDLSDAQARAMWALGEIMSNESLPIRITSQAKETFLAALPSVINLTHFRSQAFVIKACARVQLVCPEHRQKLLRLMEKYADSLLEGLKKNTQKSWLWFEKDLLYNNGVLPESLLIAGATLNKDVYTSSGLLTLNFLISKTFSADMYRPIGHSEWYTQDQKRSHYDQQPEDPASMISALTCAYAKTNDELYLRLAKKCFSWFLGNNSLHESLYDVESGGCYDGLHPDRVNLNQGAESLISYLMSSHLLKELP